jgi:hypothetical protein
MRSTRSAPGSLPDYDAPPASVWLLPRNSFIGSQPRLHRIPQLLA